MRSWKYIVPAIVVTTTPITNAWAATERSDSSGILVWAFLAFCALIVLLQLVPALLMLFGFMKGLTPAGKEQVAATEDEQ